MNKKNTCSCCKHVRTDKNTKSDDSIQQTDKVIKSDDSVQQADKAIKSTDYVQPEKIALSERRKERSHQEYRSLMNRLKRIEGQVRGIEGMLEKEAYCPDILIQVSSINSALNSFNKELMASHIRGCVANDIRQGNDDTIDELVKVMQKLMK